VVVPLRSQFSFNVLRRCPYVALWEVCLFPIAPAECRAQKASETGVILTPMATGVAPLCHLSAAHYQMPVAA